MRIRIRRKENLSFAVGMKKEQFEIIASCNQGEPENGTTPGEEENLSLVKSFEDWT